MERERVGFEDYARAERRTRVATAAPTTPERKRMTESRSPDVLQGGRGLFREATPRSLGAVLVLALSSLAGCSGGDRKEETPKERKIFAQHQFLKAAKPNKQLGDDCTVSGASECLSNLCYHYKPDARAGFVCSRECKSTADCPVEWECRSVYPPSQSFCSPPVKWTPHPAVARPQRSRP